MAQFSYKAKQGPHRTEAGTVEAFSRAEAADVLNARGLVPITIEEMQGGAKQSVRDGRGGLRAGTLSCLPISSPV